MRRELHLWVDAGVMVPTPAACEAGAFPPPYPVLAGRFPSQTAILRRQGRYRCSTVPAHAQEEAQSLFVTECIKTYNSDWHLVNYKYEDYSGEFRQLPNKVAKLDKLPVHVYEVDEEVDKDEDAASLGSQKGGITKHGWLYKGNMNSAISVTMRREETVIGLVRRCDC